MYLLIDEDTKEAAIVDPVEPNKVKNFTFSGVEVFHFLHRWVIVIAVCYQVVDAIKKHGVKLKTVLTTHHHW